MVSMLVGFDYSETPNALAAHPNKLRGGCLVEGSNKKALEGFAKGVGVEL